MEIFKVCFHLVNITCHLVFFSENIAKSSPLHVPVQIDYAYVEHKVLVIMEQFQLNFLELWRLSTLFEHTLSFQMFLSNSLPARPKTILMSNVYKLVEIFLNK